MLRLLIIPLFLISNSAKPSLPTATTAHVSDVVVVRTWSLGKTKVKAKSLSIELSSENPEYEIDVGSENNDNHFKLRFRHHNSVTTFGKPRFPCWIADLRQVSTSNSGVRIIGPNLLSPEGPGVGDNFPREEWAGYLCPLEKPNPVFDGGFYSIRADRKFLIHSFVLNLQVTDYQFDKDEKTLNVQLLLTLSNQ